MIGHPLRPAILSLLALSTPVAAQEIMPCEWQASAQSIVEPWSENSRTFANGDVRVTNLDTIEPAVGFAYLMVLSPPYDELGGRQCALVGAGRGVGFAGLDFDSLVSGYDPSVGLIFEVVVRVYDPDTATAPRRFLTVTLNQSTGDMTSNLTADNL